MRNEIGSAFGAFPDPVTVRVLADREGFSRALRDAWGIPETACWMVGAADDRSIFLLSPGVWADEACEHDPADAGHRRRLIAHEAVHVYHGQVNPSPDIGTLEEIGWFVEGLATWASGQLVAEHAQRAGEAISTGAAPARLMMAWSGPYRYGVSGSLVAFVDARWARETLRDLLAATTEAELLALLGVTEAEFLALWREWVEAGREARVAPARAGTPSVA